MPCLLNAPLLCGYELQLIFPCYFCCIPPLLREGASRKLVATSLTATTRSSVSELQLRFNSTLPRFTYSLDFHSLSVSFASIRYRYSMRSKGRELFSLKGPNPCWVYEFNELFGIRVCISQVVVILVLRRFYAQCSNLFFGFPCKSRVLCTAVLLSQFLQVFHTLVLCYPASF